MNRRNKIAVISHVNPFSKGSGQIQRVYNMLLALADNWEIEIYTTDEHVTNNARVDELKSINTDIKINYVSNSVLLKFLGLIYQLLPYFGFGKKSNWVIPYLFKNLPKQHLYSFDVILFEYWHLYKLGIQLQKKGMRVVCDTHNILSGSYQEWISKKSFLPDFWKNYLIKRYRNLEFNAALKNGFGELVAINQEEFNIYQETYPEKRIHYCPMGVKLPPIKNEAPKQFNGHTIAYYGGLGNVKNENDAIQVIQVFNSLKINHPGLRLKIIGSNPSKNLIEAVNKDPFIQVTGFVDNLEVELHDVDLAIIPFSGKYGFRSRLVELMYYKVPVITSTDAVWGMGFINKKTVLIYHEGALKELVESYLNNFAGLISISKQAKEFVGSHYTFEATYSQFSKNLLPT
jgi:glycosyltransferase involved in cell wall biosynthesis